ncbi:MAG: 16S rRNA (adenine(1518)-N(6)/adenine(1519)-N(6))-dimethyltransferase RsmA [Candidatus Rehaiarchaeum fermentans]|nr:16S rRNA (adenine(1518)-N(6)/adenine(1519)-N(6))-dimethyltransferase RsmA [Candidatus Rehaiarchaeum fermentans]MCW1297112.1 16S rRNA (adenine(1518)-N(6)/adenine(1519)-N(6))-dimethyltransferase RsmA [Candidatus Rehaiarchaeum fermentans]MCW1302394.1 16S rRNA (adenine(1518)-N(6)/adenine(1519)-N(6))-dimethyltransferase RsmA [Candidatus Rehaiarchaeum fermentans]
MNTSQVFLVNKFVMNKIIDFADLTPNDVVMEIGSGDGRLTELIAKKAKKVYAIEIDKELADVSIQKLKNYKNVEIINDDALKIEFPKVNKIISNLPYSIASPLTQKIIFYLNRENAIAILMYQKELADRILAFPGAREYSMLTILVQYACEVKKLMDVSKMNFRPVPSVDSSLLYLKPKPIEIDRSFLSFCKILFFHKKKNVYSSLMDSREILKLTKEEIRDKIKGIDLSNEKVFYLSIEELFSLYKQCKEKGIWKGESYQDLNFYD